MFNFKVPKLVQVYKVSKGKLWFVCTCGRLASVEVGKYHKQLRCKNCNYLNTLLISSMHFRELSPLELDELFAKFYSNGLLHYAEGVLEA